MYSKNQTFFSDIFSKNQTNILRKGWLLKELFSEHLKPGRVQMVYVYAEGGDNEGTHT